MCVFIGTATEERDAITAWNNLPVDIGARVERLFNRSGWGQGDYTVLASDKGNGEPVRYRTRFTCVRRGVRIVPPPATPPRPALQSAIVVGPENEQVWCDELGRVKVHFPATHPEGRGGGDGDSAWVRVASSWAGNGPGGSVQCGVRLLPPVGAEVLVDWAGGHPGGPGRGAMWPPVCLSIRCCCSCGCSSISASCIQN